MFGFLNSTILLAGAAALIPLIIHLFSRRPVKVVEFSSLKHLKAMQRRQVRRLKIRQLLLLLLRMLIIFAAVLAFARPTTQSGDIGSHATVSAVILFDNSASMNRYVADGNLFELARLRTSELLDNFGEADEVALIPLDQTSSPDGSLDLASVAVAREKLSRLASGWGRADLEGALESALTLLETSANLNREIYILTDRQRRSLPNRPILETVDARVHLVDLPLEPAENIGIVEVGFGGQLIIPGHSFEIAATIKNYSDQEQSDLIASLFLDGNRIAQTDFSLSGSTESIVRFTRSISSTGFHSGYVEISDDKFMADNRYYFSFKVPQQFNLLVVGQSAVARLISLALVPAASVSQYWSVKHAGVDDLAGINFLDYDVVIVSNPTSIEDSYARRLESFVRKDRSLFLIYDGTPDIQRYNRLWSEISQVVIEQPSKQQFSRAGYYSLATIEVDHPVFSVFETEASDLPELKFYALPKTRILENGKVLARFTGDRPALIESRHGGGRVLTMAAAIDPAHSDLTGHAFFVPFISRIAEYLAADLSSYDLNLYVGDKVSRSLAPGTSIKMALRMMAPDSTVFSLSPEESDGNLLIHAEPATLAGIYHLSYIGRELDRFALNLIPNEGDLAEVDQTELATAIGADPLQILPIEGPLNTVISELRFGRELWQIFLWIAVILMLVEILLSRATNTGEKE